MSNTMLQQAFADCVDRLATGQSLESCLQLYPELADNLQTLLTVAQAPSQLRASEHEIAEVRQRLDPHIHDLIDNTDFSQRPIWRLPTGSIVLVASLAVVIVGIFLLLPRNTGNIATELPATTTVTESATATITETDSPAATVITPDPTMTSSVTATTVTLIPVPEDVSATSTSDVCEEQTEWEIYRIQRGDTLSQIAVSAGTTVNELLAANCLEQGTIIIEGQTLFVPRLWDVSPPDTPSFDSESPSSGGNNPPAQQDDRDDDEHDDDEHDEDDEDESDESDDD